MPEPRFRSRSLKRVQKKLPGGKTVTHYENRKPSLGVCPETGEKLQGVPRERPKKMQTLGISKKRPSRPFAGVLSSKGMRKVIKKEIRKDN